MIGLSFAVAMRRRLATLATLDADEWRILIAAWCLVPMVAVSLRLLDYPRTRAAMARWVPGPGRVGAPDLEVTRVARLVGMASRHGVCSANCLRLALVAWWLLARRGIATELKLGVRKDHSGFAAHAWVERGGVIVLGGSDARERYVPVA